MRFTMLKLPAFFLVQFLRRKADCEKKKKQQRTNTTVVAFAGRIVLILQTHRQVSVTKYFLYFIVSCTIILFMSCNLY